tara:strand:+ start:1206 stop:1634 length:429 start_codon:yes stop_codon:yes gene_type:complete
MTASSSNWEKTSKLKDRINNLLDFTPDIKIRKLEQGTVQVNDYYIQNQYGLWKCSTESFFRRKSAVGYALCLINKDSAKAKQIKELDRQLQKVKTDIDFYYYHMRRGKPNRKITMSNRISADMPLLHDADTKLTQLLKTVQL